MKHLTIILALLFTLPAWGQRLPNQFPLKSSAEGADELYTQASGVAYRIKLDTVRLFMSADIDLTPLSYDIDSTGSNVVDSLRGRFVIDLSGDWWYVDKDKKAVLIGAPETGQANTGANVGDGTGVFYQKSGVQLQFKSLKAGGINSIASTDTTITITGTEVDGSTTNELGSVSVITNVPDTTSLTPKAGDMFVNTAKDTMGIYASSWVLFFGGGSVEQADGLTILGDGTGGSPFRVNTDSLHGNVLTLNYASPLLLPPCSASASFVFSGLVVDDSIRVGSDISSLLDETASVQLAITYIQEQDGYAHFEMSGTLPAGIYFPLIEYKGIVLSPTITISAQPCYTDTLTNYPSRTELADSTAAVRADFPAGDNLGDHTATTTLDLAGNNLQTNGGIILGGTGTGSDLILQSTSGVGDATSEMLFLVGNNGGTEAMRIRGNGNVGINQSTPAQTLHVQGTARITGSDGTPTGIMGRDADGDISSAGSGTTNYVPKWTGAATLGNSLVYDNGTNVIIGGTTVPSITGAKILTLVGSGASAAGRAFLVCQTTNSTSATGAVFVNSSNRFAGMQYSSASYSGGESMSVFTAGDYPVDFATNGANPFGGTSSIIFRPGGYLETPAIVAQSKKVSFGTSNTPRYTIDAGYTTDGAALPVGTTAQRPAGADGVIRYNSTLTAFEGYGSSAWNSILTTQAATGKLTAGSVAFGASTGISQDNSNLFWNDTDNRLGIGTNAPDVSLDFTGKTDGVDLPAGTTAQRPTSDQGTIRFNTDLKTLEVASASTWFQTKLAGTDRALGDDTSANYGSADAGGIIQISDATNNSTIITYTLPASPEDKLEITCECKAGSVVDADDGCRIAGNGNNIQGSANYDFAAANTTVTIRYSSVLGEWKIIY